jgi:quercetin dioxygenase-like cupin family protein
MHEHHADAPISVHALEGRIQFEVGGQSHQLLPGHLLVVAAGLPHSVTAMEQSAFLLTIGGHDGVHGNERPQLGSPNVDNGRVRG